MAPCGPACQAASGNEAAKAVALLTSVGPVHLLYWHQRALTDSLTVSTLAQQDFMSIFFLLHVL